uniref:Putative permease of the major facilitator superfamily protein n=2 Tax=Nyssomyia neivai TaxID=330878 RepID=A0A1L8DET0_9DIPT
MVSQVVSKILGATLGKFPVRFNIAVMLFLGCMISYMLRVNFSMTLLAMVEAPDAPDYGPRYAWDKSQQGLVLGAYFWGYMVSSLPGSMLVERFGGKTITTYILALNTLITATAPLFASWGFAGIYISRFLTGFFSGPQYPAMHNLIAKWAPPDEKGKFVATLLGGTFGTVITWPILGVLIENVGWSFGFYVPALITGVICIMWYYIVANDPQSHSWITKDELEHIEKSLGTSVAKVKPPLPIAKILTSVPYLALIVLHFGNMWGMFFLMTAAPKFMSEVLNFNLSKAGVLSALPYLARLIFGLTFGSIGDMVRKREWLSVTAIRKNFTIFSHILPGLFLASLSLVDVPYACVAIITISLAFNGAACITNLQNSHDLAPNFAGILYGIMNFVGTTAGFMSPLVVAHFTKDGNTLEDWRIIFIIGAIAYITPAIVFMIFGSGVTQSWNDGKKVVETIEGQEKQDGEKNA